MSYPMLTIQQAVYSLLNGDATLQNLINGIYDQSPDDAVYPFIVFDQLSLTDWSFDTASGAQIALQLHAYSRYHGKSETYGILKRIYDLLHQANLTASGYTIVQSRMLASQVDSLSDGRTTRGQISFELLVHN